MAAQTHPNAVSLAWTGTETYRTIERSDWSRYDNGKYIGHVYREVRATLSPKTRDTTQGVSYQGNFFVLEETLRDLRQSARAVDDVIPVSFQIFPNGNVQIEEDRGFPSLRGFPAFPSNPVSPGSKWIAKGTRVVDPLNEGYPVVVPIIAEYEYQGQEIYRDIPVHRISAQYAARFQDPTTGESFRREPSRGDPTGKGCFKALQGSHTIEILLRVSDGLPLLIRDTLDETFSWPNGSTVRFRGFTLTFGEGIIPLNVDRVIASIGRGTGDTRNGNTRDRAVTGTANIKDDWEKTTNIALSTVPGGIRLTVKDIRFAPDSDEFLSAEYPRLDKIAEALRQTPDRMFLVEGHTAATGRPEGEMELSIRRAKRMVDELVKRGIGADRFMYKGWGGARPLGDNSTDEGRSLNRRVEITILE